MKDTTVPSALTSSPARTKIKQILGAYQLYLLALPAIIYIILFHYGPMYGVQIAFKDFRSSLGIIGSPWVGFKHFERFLSFPNFWLLIRNTLGISLYALIVGFPLPIALAIMINEVRIRSFQKTVQMIAYAPHFISTVVVAGMISLYLNHDHGIINNLVSALGGPRIAYLAEPEWFKTVFVMSNIWQHTGWGTVIYLAALSGIDPALVEAAEIDGASKLQKIWHIDIPGITPTIVILLILRVGQLLTVGFEKILLLQNPLNMESSDVIATYIYRIGLLGGQFSFTTAIGVFNSIVNFILLVSVNQLARRTGETSLW